VGHVQWLHRSSVGDAALDAEVDWMLRFPEMLGAGDTRGPAGMRVAQGRFL
jgi:hypothetical protein